MTWTSVDADLDRRLAELMRRAQEGERRAYEELLTEAARLVRELARHRLDRADLAEDVVQETLISLHRARHTYDPGRPFGPWLYAIARHRLTDLVRTQRRHGRLEVLGHERLEELGPEDASAEPRLSAGFLRRALARLSRKQREVIRMLKLEDRSVAEISRRTGLSASSVKVTAHRGYKKLRAMIASEEP